MADIEYDGLPSPGSTERALVEVAAQRDQLDQQVRELQAAHKAALEVLEIHGEERTRFEELLNELLEAVSAHRSLWKGEAPVRNEGLRKVWDDDQKLYAAADKVRKERGDE